MLICTILETDCANLHRLVPRLILVQIYTMLTPQRIYDALEARRQELGLSQAEVGARAFGKADNSAFQALRRGSSPSAEKLEALCSALGWEMYIGPHRDTGTVEVISEGGHDYAHIPVHEASLSAGNGFENGCEEIVDHLAFRRSWLHRLGLSASSAILARIQGDSMAPSIHHGDLVLIDISRAEIPVRPRPHKDTRPAPIYALLIDGQARVKRIERPEPEIAMLVSDNPAFGPELLTRTKVLDLKVIGKVMWWGHTNME